MDRRSSKPEVLRELRERVIEMRKKGMTHVEIAGVLDIGESTSRKYWSLYVKGGKQALKLGKRGRRKGANRRLDIRQENAVRKLIEDKTPDQLKMPFALWTRQAVGELIRKRYGVRLPVRTLGEYLKRWGFTPQKPKRRDYEQQPQQVREWIDENYPAIARRAKAQKGEIFWGVRQGSTTKTRGGADTRHAGRPR